MKRIFSLIISTIVLSCVMMALPVDEQRALRVAQHFLSQRGVDASKLANVTSSTHFDMLYIFATPDAFAIVSADDAVEPILGYSASNSVMTSQMPNSVADFLQNYENQIAAVRAAGIEADKDIAAQWTALEKGAPRKAAKGGIEPLVQTKWDQGAPYNNMCPYDEEFQQHAVTGCAATAMAQIMRYWEYPMRGTGEHSYNHNKYGTQSANFGETNYDWLAMPTKLKINSAQHAINATATLCYHCGVSIDMGYSTTGSGAFTENVAYALPNYFGYGISGILSRAEAGASLWIATLKIELNEGRPMFFVGYGSDGGHAWVCDGYDDEDKFHMNWGWGGYADGFFVLTELAPGTAGIGSGDGQYNSYNHVIYGIAPPNRLRVSATEVPMTVVGDSVIVRVFTADNSDNWQAETASDWLIIAVGEGEGYGQRGNIVLKADTNYSGAERRATVVVRQGVRETTFEVLQYSCGSVTTLPYFEGFEGYTTDCWYLETADGNYDSAYTIINKPSYIYEGEHSLQFAYSKREPQRRQMLISPRFESGTSMLLSFHYMRQWSYKEHFSVLYSTTDDAPESFIYLIGDGGMADAEWQTFEGIVPEEARYIAIVYDNLSEEGRNWVVDNITLAAADEQYGAVAEFPYTQSFETGMAGWSSLSRNVDNMAKYGHIQSTQARTGQNIFRFTSSKAADDYNQYLVSPRLQMSDKGTVSFYYRRSGNVDEKICLLYSTTGSTPECFSLLADTITVSQNDWTQYSAELPEGTRYVAINYCTQKGKYLYIDDITIESAATEGLSEADNATMRVAVDGRRIRVSGVSSEVRLYDAAGRQIGTRFARHGNADFVVPATGVYLLQSGTSKAQKVVVF